MKKPQNKLFVVRKYVWAKDLKQALRREKVQGVDDVWLDEDFRRTLGGSKEIGLNK